jgi:hypothetical protein
MKILDRLPISGERTSVRFGDRYVRVSPDQILVWVSVHLADISQPEANIPRIPALLDSGKNFEFSLQHRHLREWAGLDPAVLRLLGAARINEQPVRRHAAAIWLYRNVPGTRDIADGQTPFRLRMPKGIAVYPPDAVPAGPRLPLLGLPAILNNDLDWWIDPERRDVTVQTRTWRRRLIRLLCRL